MPGAEIRHGGPPAHYQPAADEIRLLPQQVFPAADPYSVVVNCHRLRWTIERRFRHHVGGSTQLDSTITAALQAMAPT